MFVTDSVCSIIRNARNTAAKLGHKHVGSEHFLLELIVQCDPQVLKIFDAMGINPWELAAEVIEIAGPGEGRRVTTCHLHARLLRQLAMRAPLPLTASRNRTFCLEYCRKIMESRQEC